MFKPTLKLTISCT